MVPAGSSYCIYLGSKTLPHRSCLHVSHALRPCQHPANNSFAAALHISAPPRRQHIRQHKATVNTRCECLPAEAQAALGGGASGAPACGGASHAGADGNGQDGSRQTGGSCDRSGSDGDIAADAVYAMEPTHGEIDISGSDSHASAGSRTDGHGSDGGNDSGGSPPAGGSCDADIADDAVLVMDPAQRKIDVSGSDSHAGDGSGSCADSDGSGSDCEITDDALLAMEPPRFEPDMCSVQILLDHAAAAGRASDVQAQAVRVVYRHSTSHNFVHYRSYGFA